MTLDANGGLMTVGELSRRTGLSIKAIRQYEALGLLYSAGRSVGNYACSTSRRCGARRGLRRCARSGSRSRRSINSAAPTSAGRTRRSGPRLAEPLEAAERRIEDRAAEPGDAGP
jgi:MerR family copper efflux transcriptional regulator